MNPSDDPSRRTALKLLASNIALITAGCGKPMEEIVPYVHMPERVVPGVPLEFASTLPLGGFGRGVICTSVEGRPIKVSGNPLHPASLGATDLFGEAHVLSLYDPDRSQVCRKHGEIASYVDLETQLAALRSGDGKGLRLLTGPMTSPTVLSQITKLKKRFPGFVWHAYDPLEEREARAGSVAAFGRALRVVPQLAQAKVVVTLQADPLGPGPWQIVNARGFADGRRIRGSINIMSRLYAVEAVPTLTGAKADHRLTVAPADLSKFVIAIAREIGAEIAPPNLEPHLHEQAVFVAQDCKANHGKALVLVGPSLPAEIHALAHWINKTLDAPISYIEDARNGAEPFESLIEDIDRNAVKALLVSGVNPVYDAPPIFRMEERLAKIPTTLHHGLYLDETSRHCLWHVPESHPLEAWGDWRAFDGTASLAQPLIEPLYDTRSLAFLLAKLVDGDETRDHDLVRATWATSNETSFDDWWRQSLHDGVIASDRGQVVDTGPAKGPSEVADRGSSPLSLILQIDATIYEGSFANNAWLQECPKPLTKEVWGNSVGISPDDARHYGLSDGDSVILGSGAQEILVPVRISAGHAKGALSLSLGQGRTHSGAIGSHVGANAYRLRQMIGQWHVPSVTLRKAQGAISYSTQKQFTLSGGRDEIFPVFNASTMPARAPEVSPKPSFLARDLNAKPFARWAMVIDNASCIGCNACVLACQVENNVPVVGPSEIAKNRDMHWLRIDAYQFDVDDGRLGFEPVPCMHCETAPCEPVCPVGASVHDSEGLNVQVYNRCVGTRFCEANCPYKVRRFNFFGYADGQGFGNLDAPVVAAHNNPNVTVRARGVMEKCTFCVQRISAARRTAEKEMRPLRDGEVTTACQNACPTQAIAFGNRDDGSSQVAKLRDEPQHFTLLGSLNTQPRTTYLADIRNPNPAFEEKRR